MVGALSGEALFALLQNVGCRVSGVQPEKVKNILLQIGHLACVTGPKAHLENFRVGLKGSRILWTGVTQQALVNFRKTCAPTLEKVINSLHPEWIVDNARLRVMEERVFQALCEVIGYLSTQGRLRDFLFFVTASDQLRSDIEKIKLCLTQYKTS